MKTIRTIFSATLIGLVWTIQAEAELSTSVSVQQTGSVFSYTLNYHFDPCECTGNDFLTSIHITVEAPITVIGSPPGWAFHTDGQTYVDWFVNDAIDPFPLEVPVYASQGGFVIQASVTTTTLADYHVTAWNHPNDTGGGSSSGQTLAPFEEFIPAPYCIADFDDGSGTGILDGGVGIEDLLYYLVLYDAGAPDADVDDGTATGTMDGGVGIEDLLYYLTRYDAGC